MLEPSVPQPPLRVLLVEDEPLVAVTLSHDLEDAGYDVVVDGDGTHAIERLRAEPFQCVVTDLRLPGADGRSVVAAAKRMRPEAAVFVVTAHATDRDARELRRLGVDELFLKPFPNEAVVARIARGARRSAG